MHEYAKESRLLLPELYKSCLDIKETESAIYFIKTFFQENLAEQLNLLRVSAPIIVRSDTGINDHLNGIEHPVAFNLEFMNVGAEIVQSLAKWKRFALAKYQFRHGEGIYTDMNAIRPSERLDNFHSAYVDQWDWEIIISRQERNLSFLRQIVTGIYNIIRATEVEVCKIWNALPSPFLPEEIQFIHSEELEAMYPGLTPSEREDMICQEKGAVFVIGIGADLKNGEPHDGRAADYDDWWTIAENGRRGLNGDIIVWYPLLGCAMELSSMGIRVDPDSLVKQLKIRGETWKEQLDFHNQLLNNRLPLTIGGGIGQSRLCMLFLRKCHIGEIQSSIWPDEIIRFYADHGVHFL